MLGCLIFPKVDWFFLSYIFLVPVLVHLRDMTSLKKAFMWGWLFGIMTMACFHFWMFSLSAWTPWYWIVPVWFGYSVYLGFFYGLIWWATVAIKKRSLWAEEHLPAVFACCWIIGEFLRSLGPIGNPAGSLGFSQTHVLLILQTAYLFGLYGVSFIVVLINGYVFRVLFNPQKQHTIVAAVVVLGIVAGWGKFHVVQEMEIGNAIQAAVIQGNHAQTVKLDWNHWSKVRNDYLHMSERSVVDQPQYIFWPETVVPDLNLQRPYFMHEIEGIASRNNTVVLFGTPIEDRNRFYNGIAAVTPEGVLPRQYRKAKLMPFGEYIPFRKFLTMLHIDYFGSGADYSPGTGKNIMTIHGTPIGTGICLESIYQSYFQKAAQDGARFFVVLVNNAWFRGSAASAQHLQMSQMRAVENNRSMVQVANTGISAFVDQIGSIQKKSKPDTAQVLSGFIYPETTPALFTYVGNIAILFAFLYLVKAYFSASRREIKRYGRQEYTL